MKKIILLCMVVASMACNKKTINHKYTVSLYAYSKNIPFAVRYHDESMSWRTDSVYTNLFLKSFEATESNQMYVLHGMNGKKMSDDSIYVKVSVDDQEAHDFGKFSNASIDISVQLTSK